MRRIIYLNFILISVGLLSLGCASTSKASAESSQEAKSFGTAEGKGTVYLYRTGRVVGAAGQLTVRVNGNVAGGTGPGTFFKWDLKPGTYTFTSTTGESSAVVQLNVIAGQVYYVRQDARIGLDTGRVSMKEVDSKKGQKEVSGCKLLVSAYVPE